MKTLCQGVILLHVTELGFNFLNKIIIFFVDSQVQKSIFGLFNQCLYSCQNKGPRGARVQNHSSVTRGDLNNLKKAILLGLGYKLCQMSDINILKRAQKVNFVHKISIFVSHE